MIAGQPVLNLELLPEDCCVLLELGGTSEAHPATVTLYKEATLVEVKPEQKMDAPAELHLAYFRVTLGRDYKLDNYEIGGLVGTGDEVRLKVNAKGDFEVSGPVFRKGEVDLSVGISSDGKLVRTGLWDGEEYGQVELPEMDAVAEEAQRYAGMLDSAAEDFFHMDFEGFAKEVRASPDVAGLLSRIGDACNYGEVM